LRDFFIQK